MQAIVLGQARQAHQARPYAWGCVSVNPNPPRVGEVSRISFPLANPGPGDVTVERIEIAVAQFGMGVRWEQLDPIGPFHLPPDPRHIEHASIEWTPRAGGHRCVRGTIHAPGAAPLMVGRNLHVLNAGADEEEWAVPFRVGNPDAERAPVLLRLGADDAQPVAMGLAVAGRPLRFDEPLWLDPGQELDATLHLRATPGQALAAIRTVEAFIGARPLDGIQVTLLRPALVARASEPFVSIPREAPRLEYVIAYAR
jgi:hypothetical protein